MAKKKTAKQLREEQKALKMQKIQASVKAKEEKKVSEQVPAVRKVSGKKNKKKTYAKAYGSKTVLVVGNDVIMTSYGERCFANLEHRITPELNAESLSSDNALNNIDAKNGINISFTGRVSGMTASSDNPMHVCKTEERKAPKPSIDLLCLKDKLEQWYFGRTFDDNIHIQLIYQIQDIEKILASHVNNIVFALDNILHETESETGDFLGMGYMRTTNSLENYKDFCQHSSKKQVQDSYETFKSYIQRKELLYFGETFYHGNTRRNPEDIYHILALVSSLRQFCFHSTFDDNIKSIQGNWLYCLDDQLSDEFKETLGMLWGEATEKLDRDFLKTNTVNLHILCEIFDKEKPEDIINAYYEFLMKKNFKNLGFSIKKLRECMLEETELNEFKEDKYNSVRSKLYKLFDFILVHHYKNDASPESTDLQNQLRACLTDEEKEKVYTQTARELTALYSYHFKEASVSANARNIKEYQEKAQVYHISIADKISSTGIGLFSQLIYMLTLLLDGKEINDLLTTLINKFDNIIGFLDILKNMNLDIEFKKEYQFFNQENCEYTAKELRIINSLARMQKPSANAKKVMFRDALRILGMDNRSDEEIDKEIERTMPVGADGKFIKGKQSFRNFIASNVIESSRFRYLVRYNNPHKTRAMIENPHVVKFVLEGIPDTQIKRYFDVCKDKDTPDTSSKSAQIDVLTGILTNIDYKIFEDVPQSAKIDKDNASRNRAEALKKQRYQAIVTLYLTVLYLVTKNLVYVNSRYVMAFHCLERDAFFYGIDSKKMKEDYRKLTRKLLTDETYTTYGHLKNQKGHRKWYVLVSKNLENSDKKAVHYFRNIAAHISVIRNVNDYIKNVQKFHSYFELYHYLVQKMIAENHRYDAKNVKTAEYLENLEKYHTYSKDFVKAYCIPFGYVVPRYKNLTINELFDRNNPLPEPKEDKEKKEV